MRKALIGGALVALSSTAVAQAPGWNYFEGDGGLVTAFVVANDGSQLLLKCDEPGRREVYALVFTQTELMPPRTRFVMREVQLRYDDGGSPDTYEWRYLDTTAAAVNSSGQRTLTRFLEKLDDAETFNIRLNPVDGNSFEVEFRVAGAAAAIQRVYDSCDDDNPVG